MFRLSRILSLFIFLYCFLYVETPMQSRPNQIAFDFYGHGLMIKYDPGFLSAYNNKVSRESIDNFMLKMKELDHHNINEQLMFYKQTYQLDDFGYYMLLSKFTQKAFYDKSENFISLFKYYMLLQNGYDVQLTYNDKVHLYGRMSLPLVKVLTLEYKGKSYADLSFKEGRKPGRESLYAPKMVNKGNPLAFNTSTPPKLEAKKSTKEFTFEFEGYEYTFSSDINKSLILYYESLPSVNIDQTKWYVNYGLSGFASSSLIKQLREAIDTMDEKTKLEFLLAFTQHTIKYKADDQFWGFEKYNFPEETLYYEYADCEDKSMLFASLVKELLNIKSIALAYKGKTPHLNVAILINKEKDMKSYKYQGKDFIVCEPTGDGFKIGQTVDMGLTMSQVIPYY